MIDSPEGHTSYGRCRLCGTVTEFSNALIDAFVRRGDSKSDTGIKDYLQESSLD